MTLRKFVSDRKGKIKRGAISRVAEHLGISPNWARRFIHGTAKPGDGTAKKIAEMIRLGLDLSPISSAPLKYRTVVGCVNGHADNGK